MNDINSIGNARLIIREVSKVIVGKDTYSHGGYSRCRKNHYGDLCFQGSRPGL